MARSHPDRRSTVFAARLTFAAALALCASLAPVHAQSTVPATATRSAVPGSPTGLPAGNSEMPIDLQAASSDFDYKNNSLLFKRVTITQGGLVVTAQQASATGLEFENSEWRLEGDVKITVPGGQLTSNEARVLFREVAVDVRR